MLDSLFNSPLVFIFTILSLIIAVTIHEFSHAFAADRLGDPTPRSQGRLSLNPLVHLDPLGTLMLVLVGFGWGKPVPFDPYNLENPRRDAALISFAGPLSNIVFAVFLSLVFKLFLPSLLDLAAPLIYLNILLAVFNLIPVYPLDGEKILAGLLPKQMAHEFQSTMRRYGTLILILLIFPFFGNSFIATLILPIINFATSLLL